MDDDGVGESSRVGEKPVVVRVKRKIGQSPLDAFWLEINERPFKRPLLDFSKLSISSSEKKVHVAEDVKPKKVLVRHLETVTDSETTVDIIHSLFESDLDEQSCSKGKLEDRKTAFKKDNRKEQLLTKAVQQHKTAAQNARFEQIWRCRKGSIEAILDKELHERCSFFDVIRVDAEERPGNAAPTPEVASLEDQKMLARFLPLLRECIPTAAEEIEADIHSSQTEEYVYDVYAVNEEMDTSEDSSKHQFPLVIVEEEEEFYDGPDDESDYDSDDSNAEDHPRNDYPEEISEEESEEDSEKEDEEEEDEEEKSEASDESKDEETSERHARMVVDEDEEFFDGDGEEDVNVYGDSDEEFENIKWSYR